MECKFILALTLFAVGMSVDVAARCDVNECPTTPKHYEELGCKPIKKKGDCCTSR
jgi:hypothetical protein